MSDSGLRLHRSALDKAGAWKLFQPPDGLGGLPQQDGAGVFWFTDANYRLGRYQGGAFDRVPEDRGLPGKRAKCLTTDAEGRLWVGTDQGIAAWTGQHFENLTPTNGEVAVNVESLLCVSDGGCWVGTADRLRLCKNRRWLSEPAALQEVIASGVFRTVSLGDRLGGGWFGHYGRGLFHVDPVGQVRRLAGTNGLPGDRVAALFEDREGNLWAGINRGGLVRLRERQFQVIGSAEGLAEAAVMSVCEDQAGAIWLGTWGDGLYRWQEGRLTHLDYPSPEAGPGGYVGSVFPARDGRLWVATHGPRGLYWLRDGGAEAQRFGDTVPVALFEDSQNQLWMGQVLAVIVTNRYKQISQADGYVAQDARAFAEDATGAVWIGTGSGCLYRYKDGKCSEHRPLDAPRPHPIWSLAADDDRTIWAGTFGGGLLRFHEGRFTRATTRQGLPNDVISQILDDGRGQLWCGSYGGIFRVSKAALRALAQGEAGTVQCIAYGRADGLPTIQCAGNYQPSLEV